MRKFWTTGYEDLTECGEPWDVPNEVIPPFKAFQGFLPSGRDLYEVEDDIAALEPVIGREAAMDLDTYFKGVWFKHHG